MSMPTLYVEGIDDKHALFRLLAAKTSGIGAASLDPQRFLITERPEERGTASVEALLKAIPNLIDLGRGSAAGFVMDADDSLEGRWTAVRNRLHEKNIATPDVLPQGGWVENVSTLGMRVGVWIMPDNRSPGSLEHLLQLLIPEDDTLRDLAFATTDEAMKIARRQPNPRLLMKSKLHAWLAWQERPGQPYGVALQKTSLKPDSAAATAFVSWAKRLFGW